MIMIWVLLISTILDYVLGDPYSWPHPIIFIGKLISFNEKKIRKSKYIPLKIGGFLLVIITLVTVVFIISFILYIANRIHPIINIFITIYLLYTSLAGRCLDKESKKIYEALHKENIVEGRKLISYLVGRDTDKLSENEICRATIETVSENTIDGVLAPLFYMLLGFLIGMPVQFVFIYKTINTLDSMVGYIQHPYTEIGYASAKLDDIVNFIPARIGSILMFIGGSLLGYDWKNGFKILIRDRNNHKSPNAGYPEATVAGLLNIQIGGTNTYFGEKVEKPTIGDNISSLSVKHILDSVKIMYSSEMITVLIMILIMIFIS
ncbi:cobalamin biosynthesis protein CobD [Clostridium sp. D2Q-11]|uniref:Cobalamin biosynthesis protein CobD n=1 Tax=Anaeromonas frigoriresistens TaxID=2683708 RepID=A0A942UV31_9FIRM|nr:adenosylcobinamide-phosphate synthase CbiB [Anaeromonas frigoriresistens]MBS4538560.1 cobalamin biosynthesis protein CobD [Anaeromonas frigoriresistens]